LLRLDPSLANIDEDLFDEEDRQRVTIIGDKLFHHQQLQLSYTTYDMRRTTDTVRLKGPNVDVMLAAQQEDRPAHPFYYGRIFEIFHVEAFLHSKGSRVTRSPQIRTVPIVRLRWFASDLSQPLHRRRLHRITFLGGVHETHWDPASLAFVDPSDIIRTMHAIPAFIFGPPVKPLSPSILTENGRHEYSAYYVNE